MLLLAIWIFFFCVDANMKKIDKVWLIPLWVCAWEKQAFLLLNWIRSGILLSVNMFSQGRKHMFKIEASKSVISVFPLLTLFEAPYLCPFFFDNCCACWCTSISSSLSSSFFALLHYGCVSSTNHVERQVSLTEGERMGSEGNFHPLSPSVRLLRTLLNTLPDVKAPFKVCHPLWLKPPFVLLRC